MLLAGHLQATASSVTAAGKAGPFTVVAGQYGAAAESRLQRVGSGRAG